MTESPREDVLVSACFAEAPRHEAGVAALAAFADRMAAHFAYFEIVVLVEWAFDAASDNLLDHVRNLRLLRVGPGRSIYHRRTIVASEAIGDMVILADLDELAVVDPLRLLAIAETEGGIVYAARSGIAVAGALADPIGRASGLSVSSAYFRTAVYPRGALNRSLRREDRDLALRFPPSDRRAARIVTLRDCAAPAGVRARSSVGLAEICAGGLQRAALLQRLMVSAAPAVLGIVAIASLGVMALAVLMAGYGLWANFQLDNVAAGWTSVISALAMIAFFFGFAVFGVSAGLQKVIKLLEKTVESEVIEERNRTDLFAAVKADFNVELAGGDILESR